MNIADYKLGCILNPPKPNALMLSRYLSSPRLEPPPEAVNNAKAMVLPEWGMMGNDRIGNCVLAGRAHTIMAVTANRGHLFRPSDDAVIGAYSAITGYDPSRGNASGYNPTDRGTNPEDALDYSQKVGIADHRIAGWGAFNPQDLQRTRQVIYIFEVAEIALALPYVTPTLQDWDIPADQTLTGDWEPYGWGGHYVICPWYDSQWFYLMTWNGFKRASRRWIGAYAVRGYGCVSEDMLDITTGLAPSGVDIAALTEDLNAVTG